MRTIKTAIVLAVIAAGAAVARSFYTATLFNGGLAYNRNFTINLATVPNPGGTLHLSAQATYSTSTITSASFTDGRVSTGSVTVLSDANLAAHAATNQVTIAATSIILAASATDYLTVLSTQSLTNAVVTYNGNPLKQGSQWFVVSTTTGTAENIKNAINKFSGVSATRTTSEVDLTATAAGAAGNKKTLAVNTSSITIGGATFGGGHNNRLAGAYLSVKGHQYWQGGPWSVASTSSGTATSVASFLNTVSGIKASAAGSVVYATATVAGTSGNAFTLVSSAPSYMTIASPTFLGGINNANVCVNAKCVTQGTDWTAQSTTTGTAKAISDALMAKSSISSIIVSTWNASSVVTATSTATGAMVNYALTTNAPGSLSLSGATLTLGQAAAWAAGSIINIPAHGLSTGLGVTFSTSSGVGLSPLVPNTVYYVGVIDANDIALSTTSAQAQVGSYIVLPAPGIIGPHTFNLAPQSFSGTPGLQWFGSNDGSNFNTIDISSVTYSSASSTPISTTWDFGRINYKYVQLQAAAPSTGVWNLNVIVNGN